MRLIAVVGVLFVLASCSDSDMPDNFSVSCYKVGGFNKGSYTQSLDYDFDLDNRIVTRRVYLKNGKSSSPERYDITEIKATHIHFGKGIQEFTFNRTDLRLVYYEFDYGRTVELEYRCKLPQV